MTDDVSPVAGRVIDKCGGARVIADYLGLAPSTVYRWAKPKSESGHGGIVPARAQVALMAGGFGLVPTDFFEEQGE